MKKAFKLKALLTTLLLLSLPKAFASDFNIPFVNGAELGNMYSGWAATANDASTQFTNPAGLTKIDHQQLVLAAIGIKGSTQFTGTSTNPIVPVPPLTGQASSKLGGGLPVFYYSVPIDNNIVVGFGANVPFALGTNYAKDSIVRYSATRSQIAVVDLGPSLGVRINDKWSLGLGLDANRAAFTLNQMYGPPFSFPADAELQNHLSGWGYGWHAGVLYQIKPATRVGLSFNSMVMFHTTGDSEVYLPGGPELRTTNQRANFALPARTQLSVDHMVNSKLSLLATVFYTNWSTLQTLTLRNTMTTSGTTIRVPVAFNYHNTFDYALGMNYLMNDRWTLRSGVMFLTTPTSDSYRSVNDPLGCGIIVGLGGHYQWNKKLGYDLSIAHGFFQTTHINQVTPLAVTQGHSSQNTNVFGAQLTWDIA